MCGVCVYVINDACDCDDDMIMLLLCVWLLLGKKWQMDFLKFMSNSEFRYLKINFSELAATICDWIWIYPICSKEIISELNIQLCI